MAAFTSHKTVSSCFPSSSSTRQWNNDVFLSFRGKDTCNNFTGHLHKDLKQAGIRTFIDEDELPRGKEISPELRKAIQESRICIIIFSKNYASSRWCLDELLEILECKKKMGQVILPVFYDVDPSDVRYQRGSFADAFAAHKRCYTAEMEKKKLEMWRAALTEASDLSGYCLKTDANGHEARFIDKIVADVLLLVDPKYLNVSEDLVGIDSRVAEIISLLSMESNDILMTGIYGLGGIGKTTVAKSVFNKILHKFEGSFFAENVKDFCKNPDGTVKLQNQILSEIINKNVVVGNANKGVVLISERCWSRKVLIVFDDLDDSNQIKSILGNQHWLGSGSRIIITTRDVQLLNIAGVDKRYELKDLNNNESLELFSRHVFRKRLPSKDYVLLSKDVVSYCKGLPLALVVIGSYLVDKTTVEWKSGLEKLRQIPHNDIQKILKISFDALGCDKERDIFLDLACFDGIIGMDKYYAITFWNACGFFAEDGISNLMSKQLLKIDVLNYLKMHAHLRDMGREIVREGSPKRPGNRSRLWCHEEVFDVLKNCKGKEEVEGIILRRPFFFGKMDFNTSTFERMDMLRYLFIEDVCLTGSFENLFKELKWLRWHRCPLRCLPSDFNPEKLVILEMKYSELNMLWTGIKVLENLKILDISYSECLRRTPDFSGLPKLERLLLKGCSNLLEVHPSVGGLVRLCFLDLSQCKNLINIPISICDLGSLKGLFLRGCFNLEKLPDSIGLLDELVDLDLRDCKNIINLPTSICNLRSLRSLRISGCSNLEKLPDQLGNMEDLRILVANQTGLKQLPYSIGNLKKLEQLHVQGCDANLENHVLYSLAFIFPKHRFVLPSSIFNLCSSRDLRLTNCSLSDDTGIGLSSLEALGLTGNNVCSLPPPSFNSCYIPVDIGIRLSSLESLDLSGNNFCILPSSLSQLSNLGRLSLNDCTSLVTIPELPPNLLILEANRCTSMEKIPNLSNIKQLTRLYFTDCGRLVEVRGLENLNNLRDVHMAGCSSLTMTTFNQSFFQRYFEHADHIFLPREIPNWISNLSMEPLISFKVPLNVANNFQGIILWCEYDKYYSLPLCRYNAVLENKTAGITWNHGTGSNHPSHGHAWVSLIRGDFSGGDSMEIYIEEGNAKVERCGIHLLYKPDITTGIDKRVRDVDMQLLPNEESSKRLRGS